MAGWQKAGEIPGLMSGGGAPPAMPQGGAAAANASAGRGGQLSFEPGLWPLLGRAILFVIGTLLVIPSPWVAVSNYRWAAARLTVPGRPNFGFMGQVGDIWYVFVLTALCSYVGLTHSTALKLLVIAEGRALLDYLRWIVANLSSKRPTASRHLRRQLARLWLVRADVCFDHYHHRLGLGGDRLDALELPQHCRHATRSPVQGGWIAGVVANARVRDRLCVSDPDLPWVLRWYAQWYVSQVPSLEPRRERTSLTSS